MIEYADRAITIDGITLFFGTPHIPYSWEDIDKKKAYSTLFTEAFLKINNSSESLQQSPLFKIGGTPIFNLTEDESQPIIEIYEKMIAAYATDYMYKDDLIRNYLHLIIHQALQLQPIDNHLNHAVKEVTGKTTTVHISVRIITEAKALLQHTDWSVAQIGYALGFEHPTHFNNYFKRLTGTTPTSLRR